MFKILCTIMVMKSNQVRNFRLIINCYQIMSMKGVIIREREREREWER